jgi:metal-responsive CopG/Arc/MetJ family transcriptional regulator
MRKERVTFTVDQNILARVDRIASLTDKTRSALMESLLETGVEELERTIEHLGSPIIGSIVQSIIDHPKLVNAIAKAIGERLDPEEMVQWQATSQKLRVMRKRLSNERGRRRDLKPKPRGERA